jgi:hypothetical protein
MDSRMEMPRPLPRQAVAQARFTACCGESFFFEPTSSSSNLAAPLKSFRSSSGARRASITRAAMMPGHSFACASKASWAFLFCSLLSRLRNLSFGAESATSRTSPSSDFASRASRASSNPPAGTRWPSRSYEFVISPMRATASAENRGLGSARARDSRPVKDRAKRITKRAARIRLPPGRSTTAVNIAAREWIARRREGTHCPGVGAISGRPTLLWSFPNVQTASLPVKLLSGTLIPDSKCSTSQSFPPRTFDGEPT